MTLTQHMKSKHLDNIVLLITLIALFLLLVSRQAPAEEPWYAGGALLGSNLYLLSGGNECEDSVHVWADNSWQVDSVMLHLRQSAGCIVVGSTLYVMGGDCSEGAMEYYDQDTHFWNDLESPLNPPRHDFGVAAVGDTIYCFGGCLDGSIGIGGATDVVSAYSISGATWETLTAMPTARIGLSCGVLGDKVYTVGGNGGMQLLEVYDTGEDSWESGPAPPHEWDNSCCHAIGGELYVLGNMSASKTVDIFDGEAWRSITSDTGQFWPDIATVRDGSDIIFLYDTPMKWDSAEDTWTAY